MRLHRHDALDLALVVENDLRLDGLEIDRAALGARFDEHLEKPVEVLDVRRELAVALRAARRAVVDHLPDGRVGEARVREHDRRVELVGQ